MKTLIIGLDGACMDLIKSWVHEGKLPTFEKLMSEGSYGKLESVIPPLTIPAWNCLASGKNPAKIGCFSFIQKASKSYDFQIYIPSVKNERNIWDILSDYGKKVFILNAPNVITAYKINGYMVAGLLCILEKKLTYPENLKDMLSEINYNRGSGYLISYLISDNNKLSETLKEMTESICEVLFHFLEKDWDFGFVVFQELDGAQHRLWNDKKTLLKHYQNIDEKLKTIIDRLDKEDDETTVLIVSDHGFGPNKRMFLVNEWLARKGFLKVRKNPLFVLINSLIRILKGSNILKILRLLNRSPYLLPLYEHMLRHAAGVPVLWNETKAFSYGNWGTIYINLKGREPNGIVKQEDYEQLRSGIIDKLKEISITAYRREEIYHGKYLESAPDIIIQLDKNVSSVSGKVGYNREFMEGFPLDGYHDINNGTFIAWGPNIKKGFENDAKIYDVAPTILHIMKFPVPENMDGRVLKEIFKEGSEPFLREVFKASNENELIKQKISALKSIGRI